MCAGMRVRVCMFTVSSVANAQNMAIEVEKADTNGSVCPDEE